MYFLDLVEHTGRQALRMGGVVAACVAADGCPRVVYRDDRGEIPAGASLAVFGMTLKMEDVLMRGRCVGVRRFGGVCNSMPPVPGRIYPPVGLEAVREC